MTPRHTCSIRIILTPTLWYMATNRGVNNPNEWYFLDFAQNSYFGLLRMNSKYGWYILPPNEPISDRSLPVGYVRLAASTEVRALADLSEP